MTGKTVSDPKCTHCGEFYVRVTCDGCHKELCLHCAKAVSDTRVLCPSCRAMKREYYQRAGIVG